MKKVNAYLLNLFLVLSFSVSAQLSVSIVGNLPVSVSNNAVCEGFVGGTTYVYSFAGIDSTKTSEGIHLKSYRFNIQNNTVQQLPDLPDTLGKIATAANRIGDTIYITGGYHVLQNGNEVSSNKIHRFNIVTNTFMADGPNIPQATDDHVQIVWKDSLLILITGWKNTGNIKDVQIYNPSTNSWSVGTPIPNSHIYKSFGASGVVLGNTIYYFGGAKSIGGFNIQNSVRKGEIDPSDPTQITWSNVVIDQTVVGYRMAATTVGNTLHWIGGSEVTYNYDGVAYNGSGGVTTINRDLYTTSSLGAWHQDMLAEIPMDLRGIANINDSTKYIVGGMVNNQMVTNNVYRLSWSLDFLGQNKTVDGLGIYFYPVPFWNYLTISSNTDEVAKIDIYNLSGQLILTKQIIGTEELVETNYFQAGIYLAIIKQNGKTTYQKLVKTEL